MIHRMRRIRVSLLRFRAAPATTELSLEGPLGGRQRDAPHCSMKSWLYWSFSTDPAHGAMGTLAKALAMWWAAFVSAPGNVAEVGGANGGHRGSVAHWCRDVRSNKIRPCHNGVQSFARLLKPVARQQAVGRSRSSIYCGKLREIRSRCRTRGN